MGAAPAWDVYLVYSSGIEWKGKQPPKPLYFMHQLEALPAARIEPSGPGNRATENAAHARERFFESMNEREHWETVYRKKGPEEVSWYRPHLERSLRFVEQAGLTLKSAILDVGGGASTLVDDLLARGFSDVSVLDISENAIARAKLRLGARAETVTWLLADITRVELPERRFDFWHDRAVFHFLREETDRLRYVQAVRRALKPNGHIVVATFGPAAPEQCSGLPVMRYTAEGIHEQFGGEFLKAGSCSEAHMTPWGSEQEFVYCYCRMPG